MYLDTKHTLIYADSEFFLSNDVFMLSYKQEFIKIYAIAFVKIHFKDF